MASGFVCDNCKHPFVGRPALELIANLHGEFETEQKTDGESGMYCLFCARGIFLTIPWEKEEEASGE